MRDDWMPLYINMPCTQCHKAVVPAAAATPLELGTSASLAICVSMSTRQMGQCLLVTSHWSTQSVWNRCIHGNRRTSFSISKRDKQIAHFSASSSVSLGRRTRRYLCGKVLRSMISKVAPRLGRGGPISIREEPSESGVAKPISRCSGE